MNRSTFAAAYKCRPGHTRAFNLPKFLDAGIAKGQVVGKAVLKYEGKPVAEVPMVASESVAEGFSITSFIVGLTEPIFLLAENFLAAA